MANAPIYSCAKCKSAVSTVYIDEVDRQLCHACYKRGSRYRNHWFIRSMRYHKPSLPARKQVKPDANQLPLF